MIDKILTEMIMLILHRMYVKTGNDIMYIRGVGKDYPKYLLYTENPNVYKRMDDF